MNDNIMIKKNFIYLKRILLLLVTFSLIGCTHQKNEGLPGYIEGKYTYVASPNSGILDTVKITKGEEVKKGQLLFSIASEPEFFDLEAARQRVNQAKEQQNALNEIYKQNKNRKESYYNLQAAKRNLSVLQASLRKAEWMAKQNNVYAPTAGLVFDAYYEQGELVQPSNPVVALLNPNDVKIIFYSPEPLLSQFKLGDVITVSCDNCESSIKGKIIYISPQTEYTPPVIYSNEERAKLAYRIEAIPLVEKSYAALHPGQPITIRLKP